MNIVRQRYKIDKYAVIESSSNVHIGAGLASSASSFAALAYAVNLALNLKLSKKELSILARLGWKRFTFNSWWIFTMESRHR